MNLDRVLTVHGYYDGHRLGVAEFRGVPHRYESESEDIYLLSPIAPDLLSLVMEDWAIWLRWEAAHKRGEVSLALHPALPHERERHEDLKVLIGNHFRTDPLTCFRCTGRFSATEDTSGRNGMTVDWETL